MGAQDSAPPSGLELRARPHPGAPRTRDGTPMSHEIELKLTLPQKSLPALRRHPLIAEAPATAARAPSRTPTSTPLISSCANAAWRCAPARPAAAGCRPSSAPPNRWPACRPAPSGSSPTPTPASTSRPSTATT
jgi:hypothetical protein